MNDYLPDYCDLSDEEKDAVHADAKRHAANDPALFCPDGGDHDFPYSIDQMQCVTVCRRCQYDQSTGKMFDIYAEGPKPKPAASHQVNVTARKPVRHQPGDPVVDLVYSRIDVYPCSETMAQFLEYHVLNPKVFDFLVESLREMQESGFTRYGFPMVFNLARWHFGVKRKNSDFVLNNNIGSHYSRAIAILHPDLDGFFEQRVTETGTADPDFGFTPRKKRA